MDIRQLKYFIAIVEHEFNMTEAAKNLYVSQPTLSIVVNNFEKNEEVSLFERTHWRLLGLTPAGEVFYDNAKDVVAAHQLMMSNLRDKRYSLKGKFAIGLPPIVSTFFSNKLLPDLISANSEIHFSVIEAGTKTLRKKLLLGQLDLAILINENVNDGTLLEKKAIASSEIVAFMSPQHQLARRTSLTWNDLKQQKLISLDDSFQLYELQKDSIETLGINVGFSLNSHSPEFLLKFVQDYDDYLVLLPQAAIDIQQADTLVTVPFKPSLPCDIFITRLNKTRYSNVETYVYQHFLQSLPYFSHSPIKLNLARTKLNQ